MLVAPPESRYDFYFNVGPIPVRISWTHWLGAALLGWSSLYYLGPGTGAQPIFLLVWMMVVFASILVHELGHAFAAKLCGYPTQVVLYHFGGLAQYLPARNATYGREVLIALAGPGAGFVFGLLAIGVANVVGPSLPFIQNDLVRNALNFGIAQLIYVNIAWTLLNLLPVLPLDGGRVCDVVCRALSPNSGPLAARWIGVFVGGLMAVLAFRFLHSIYVGAIFLMFALWNYQDIQNSQR